MNYKIVLELSGTPTEGDMLVFDGTNFTFVRKKVFDDAIEDLQNRVTTLEDKVEQLEQDVALLKGED